MLDTNAHKLSENMPSRSPTFRRKRSSGGSGSSGHGGSGVGGSSGFGGSDGGPQQQPSSSQHQHQQQPSSNTFLTPAPKVGGSKALLANGAHQPASASSYGTAATAASTPPSAVSVSLSSVSSVPSAAPMVAPTPHAQHAASSSRQQQRRLTDGDDSFFDTPYERDDFFEIRPEERSGQAGAGSAGRVSEVGAGRRHDDDDDAADDDSPVAIHRRSRVLFHEEGDEEDLDHPYNDSPADRHHANIDGERRSYSLEGVDFDDGRSLSLSQQKQQRVSSSSPAAAAAASAGAAGGASLLHVPPPPPPLPLPQDPTCGPRRSQSSPRMSPSRNGGGGSSHRQSPAGSGSSNHHRRRSSRQHQQQQQHRSKPPMYDDYAHHHASAPDVTVGTTRLRGSYSKPERRRAASGNSSNQQQCNGNGNGGGHRTTLSHPPPYHPHHPGDNDMMMTKSSKLSLTSVDDTTPLTSSSSGEPPCSSNESSPERYNNGHHHHGLYGLSHGASHSMSSVPQYASDQHHHHQQHHDHPSLSVSSPSKDKYLRQQQFFRSQRFAAGGAAMMGGPLVASSAEHSKNGHGMVSPSSAGGMTSRSPNSSGTPSKPGDGSSLSSPLPSSPLSPRVWGTYLSASKVKIRFRTLLTSGLGMICVLFTLLLLANFRNIPADVKSPSAVDIYENEPVVYKPVPSRKVGATATAATSMSVHEASSASALLDQDHRRGGGGGTSNGGDAAGAAGGKAHPVKDDHHKRNIVTRRGAGALRVARTGAAGTTAQQQANKGKNKAKKKKRKFPYVDSEFYASQKRHPIKNGGYPRILTINHTVQKDRPPEKKKDVELYPAEFTDNTQLYSVLDSDDERLDRMEMREPYEGEECVPMHDWQTTFHPSCNGMHELDMEHGHDEDEGEDMQLFGTKGFWRHAWRVDLPGEKRTLKERDTFVLKTLKYEHNFEDNFEEHDRVDAIAMERLTSSPHVINIYGFCGHSVVTEFADGPRVGTLADKSKKVPLKRLEIARDIASGLADVHTIDGEDQASFVHLDINPANVVVVGKTLKLNDFNIGIILKKNKETGEQCGFPAQYPNPQWRSPEEANESDNLTEKVDIFSMGHIFYRLICGHEPWNKLEPGGRPTKEESTEMVKQGKLPFIPEDIINTKDPEIQAIRDAMLKCYSADPEKRPSARTVATFLDKKLKLLSQTTEEENKPKVDEKIKDAKKEKPKGETTQTTEEENKTKVDEKIKDAKKEKPKGETKVDRKEKKDQKEVKAKEEQPAAVKKKT